MELKMEFNAPEDFVPMQGLPPAYDYGKFYVKAVGEDYELGFFVRPEHSRTKTGVAGGGIFLTAADYLMGFVLYKKLFKGGEGDAHPTTVTMTTDFLGSAKVGDWLTAKVEVLKVGRSVCSVQCLLFNADKTVLRASASYIMVPRQ
jgi:acyl-coenzyme A thioesterase PaaI-like protein